MALIRDLTERLHSKFPGSTVKLSTVKPGNRIGGTLLWKGFDGQAQIDRQVALREVIDDLPASEQLRISFILTLTPGEHALMTAPEYV